MIKAKNYKVINKGGTRMPRPQTAEKAVKEAKT